MSPCHLKRFWLSGHKIRLAIACILYIDRIKNCLKLRREWYNNIHLNSNNHYNDNR